MSRACRRDALASIWLGNRTRIAAHYDMPDNLACVAVGRRRFTLFPPTELPNLYVGPLEFTPAGQQISLVDFASARLERFPRFATALRSAQVAELDAGDALYIPGMWWHHVEALDAVQRAGQLLVADQSPAWMGAPVNALMHAMLSRARSCRRTQRAAWRGHLPITTYSKPTTTRDRAHPRRGSPRARRRWTPNRARALRALLLEAVNR